MAQGLRQLLATRLDYQVGDLVAARCFTQLESRDSRLDFLRGERCGGDWLGGWGVDVIQVARDCGCACAFKEKVSLLGWVAGKFAGRCCKGGNTERAASWIGRGVL